MKLQMVDLKGQYNKIKSEVDEAIQDVINTTAFVKGPKVKQFEDNLAAYLGVKHVVACGNGTDALQIALMSLGLKPGDEVIAPSFTFIATAEVIALLHLTPVLVDVDINTFNISPEAVRQAITPKTKAIIPVHLFGQSAPMDELLSIAKEHQLFVVEDACQSIGGDLNTGDNAWKKSGTVGDIGCTSFFPSKNLGCYGDGGAMFTNNDDLASKLRSISNHGMVVRYHHDMIGVNSRLDGIQAAILDVKLPHLDTYGKARQKAAAFYDAAFAPLEQLAIPAKITTSTHVYHQYTLRVLNGQRDELRTFLNEHDVPAMVYYPIPLHLQTAYTDPRYKKGDFPISEQLSNEVISLPMHTELDKAQLEKIVSTVIQFFNQ